MSEPTHELFIGSFLARMFRLKDGDVVETLIGTKVIRIIRPLPMMPREDNMEQAIQVAVQWWEQWLQKPAPQDVGDGTLNLWLTYAAAAAAPIITDEQIARFKMCLKYAIEKDIAKHGRCVLNVDYDPKDTLYDVCKVSRVYGKFPYKTTMSVLPDRVGVTCGYGQPYQVLFGSEEEASE